MAKKISIKRYAGVYYSESTRRKWRERPERVYWVSFRDARSGILRWERCGWASEGWTPEKAQRKRHHLLEQDRSGDYKPKQKRKAERITLREFMEDHYLPWSDENKRRARDDRSMYKNWVGPALADKTLSNIVPLDLERLKMDMKKAGRSDATVKHALCLVRQAFNKAVTWGLWQGANPCSSVSFPRPNNARHRFLTHEEADRVFTALHELDPQTARVATLSLYGGLRLGEIFGLTWSNIDKAHDIIHILDTKSGESRPIFITNPIGKILEELPPGDPNELLFKTSKGGPVVWLSKAFKKVVDSLKMNDGVSDRRERVTFHTLRHTYASWAVMAGVPLYQVGKALGHKTLTMTQRYSHLAPESQRAVFEAVAKSAEAEKEKQKEEGQSGT